MTKSFLALIAIVFLTSCLEKEKSALTSVDDSPPKSGFYYKKLNQAAITDYSQENSILRCSKGAAGNYCESICVSEDFPQYQRWTLAMSNYEANGKCFAYLFAFSKKDGSIPEMKYFVGNYATHTVNGSLKGYCSGVDITNPDYHGRWAWSFQTSHDYLNWLDVNSNLYRSIQLQSNNGDIFTYYDSDFNDNITIQTRNGYDCRKLSEITTATILGQEI
jgi:hypothetical protein